MCTVKTIESKLELQTKIKFLKSRLQSESGRDAKETQQLIDLYETKLYKLKNTL